MAFHITEFKSTLGKLGIAKPSSFAVNLFPPAIVNSPNIRDLPFLCDSVNIPGINFQVEEFRHKGYGLGEARPIHTQFEDCTLTLIGDGSGVVLDVLQKWMLAVNNYVGERETSVYGTPSESYNYPEEYWGTLEIHLYNIGAENYHTYTMHKAFPVALGAVQYSWEQIDELVRIPVSFSYRSYTSTTTELLTSSETPINNQTGRNDRNVGRLESLLVEPNIPEYINRFATV